MKNGGVKGVKVDFMQRDDQKIVNFYLEAAKKTAEHHLLIDFHGAYKPMGLDVRGLMHSHAKGWREWRMINGAKRLHPNMM